MRFLEVQLEKELPYDRAGLLGHIHRHFAIDWNGIHGIDHWRRVARYGIQVGAKRQADLLVVELFAFVHDSCRISETHDPRHGERGAELAFALQGTFFDLSPRQLDLLCTAIRFHSDGWVHPDATIQSCWDGDRLDLKRVGIEPHRDFLSKEAGELFSMGVLQNFDSRQERGNCAATA